MLTSLSDTGATLADRGLFAGVLSKPVRSTELESNIARALGDSSRGLISSAPELAAALNARLRSRRLLIAEDNPINQEVLVEVLSGLGYHADVVDNGRLAVEAWAAGDYPLILMDCQMPELDGYQAARRIRELEAGGPRVAIIAVTAHALVGERERAIAAGMDDYVTKPIDQRLLKQALERWWPKGSLFPGPRPAGGISSSMPASLPDAAEDALDPSVTRSQGVVRVFLRHVPEQLASLALALDAGDDEALRSAAHKLKGSCLSVGVPRMAALCASLETEPGAPAERADKKAQLEREFLRVQEQLSQLLPLKSA
jgi:CheY-like chemotaxis protein/HPt (histidine-containing phosphotransfer) domain-containing protein